MAEFSILNGKLLNYNELNIFNNRAFKYGDGIFESIRIVNGKAVFLQDHFERLSKGLQALKIEKPFDFPTFERKIAEGVAANKLNKGGRLRLSIYRDAEGFYAPNSHAAAYFMEFKEVDENHYTLNSQGWRIDICDEVKIECNQFSALKTLNALPYVMAAIHKNEQQLDEVLLLNTQGQICEGSSSNVFLIADNTLLTPPLSHGCVEGVMRKNILQIAQKMQLRVVENAVGPKEMEVAEEVFFTNAIQGIRWVSAFRKKRYFHNQVNLILKELNRKF